MPDFIVFAVIVIAFIVFIIYNGKGAAGKGETLRRENTSKTTARPEDVLTEGGIPKRRTPRPPSSAQAQSSFLKRPEQIHVTYRTPDNSTTKDIASGQPPKAPPPHIALEEKDFFPVDLPRDSGGSVYTSAGRAHAYSAYTALLDCRYTPGDKILIRAMLDKKENCTICGCPTAPDATRATLSNGLHTHRACHAALCKDIRKYQSDSEIPAQDTKDFEALRRLIITNQYWPTYPDDWEQRKSLVIKNAERECESCGEDSLPLHVHHIQELTAGGSNELENLQCLCENCHDDIHSGLLSKNIDITKGKNRRLIDQALNTEQDIEFTYKDVEGNYTRRAAKPLYYTKTPHGASAVRAFCRLRGAERTFIIRKMSKMKIL